MKLLLFSDLHCDLVQARALVKLAEQVDVVVAPGDFCNMRRGLTECVAALRDLPRPAVLTAGNSETHEELLAACRDWPAARVLHGAAVEIAGVTFFGVGGAIPVTPFGAWSHDLTEDQGRALLAPLPTHAVLACHAPPRGVVDADSRGQHLGSEAVREAVERTRPQLVVCGHIHGSAGQIDKLGPTVVVNAGPQGVIWDLEAGAGVACG